MDRRHRPARVTEPALVAGHETGRPPTQSEHQGERRQPQLPAGQAVRPFEIVKRNPDGSLFASFPRPWDVGRRHASSISEKGDCPSILKGTVPFFGYQYLRATQPWTNINATSA